MTLTGHVMGWQVGRARAGVAISVNKCRNQAYRKQKSNTEAKSSREQKRNDLRKRIFLNPMADFNIRIVFSVKSRFTSFSGVL